MDASSGRSAASQALPPAPPTVVVPQLAGTHHELSMQWGQLQFLLSDGVTALNGQAAIVDTQAKAEQSLAYLDQLEQHAKQLGLRTGALSRLILPFDVDTNSNDQASSAGQVPLGSRELEAKLPREIREELVASACTLRKLIRVKVADCRDIDQAREALKMLVAFLTELRRAADAEKCAMTALLRTL